MSYWRDDALCLSVPGDVWFPGGRGIDRELMVHQAITICHGCPVRVQCARYALDTKRSIGVWGGVDLGDKPSLSRPTKEAAAQLRQVIGEVA